MSASQSEHHHARRHEDEDEIQDESPPPAASATKDKEALDADVDALLDEIDEVLEHNAEEFVRGFVQKGGQ